MLTFMLTINKSLKMKSNILVLLIGTITVLSAFTIIQSTNWQVAEGYSIKFTSKDPSGVFTKMSADILFDENKLNESKFAVIVDVASINTGNGMQNKHAKTDMWFSVKQFPSITFTSSKFSKSSPGFQVTGVLEMHGVKKEISFPFTFTNNTFVGSFTVNRLDYKIGVATGMSAKVPSNIKIDLSVPVIKR